jgi:hypothetical protein
LVAPAYAKFASGAPSATAKPVSFGLKIAPDSIDSLGIGVTGASKLGFVMGMDYDRLGMLFRLGGLLRAAENTLPRNALVQRNSPFRDDDILSLLEENARLRKLAVKLSNIIGDLPPASPPAGDDG